jgi:histidinol-phosphate aminotransferase
MRHLVRGVVIEAAEYAEYGKELTPASVAEEYHIPTSEIADLSLNINVHGPPPGARRAVLERLDTLRSYPDVRLVALRACIAAIHGLPIEAVLMGAGVDDLLKLIAQTFIDPWDRAIIPIPTFPRYELEVRLMGGLCDLVPLTPGFELPVDAVLGRVTPRTKLIFVCSPNNPTGIEIAHASILRLLALGDQGPLVVVDEALIYPGETGALDLVPDHPNLLVLRTFSKYYGLAGARVGYAVGDPELLAMVDLVRPSYNVGTLSEAAVLGALSDPGFLVDSRAALKVERSYLLDALNGLPGLVARPSQTSIMLLDVSGTGRTSTEIAEALAAHGVVVVDCRIFKGLEDRDYLRISLGTPRANRCLVEALRAIL